MLAGLARKAAARTLGLRVGIVGVNFAVMLALAALLGFATFGQLAALWGAAQVAGTVLSLGGPVILLRALTDGPGIRARDIAATAVVYPALLAVVVYVIADMLWPLWPWAAVVSAGYLINVLGCLASVMRALGSVQASMALRDAGPQVALGVAAGVAWGGTAADIMLASVVVMSAQAVAGLVWVLRRHAVCAVLSTTRRSLYSPSLWVASVLGTVVAQIDLILGAAFIPAEQLGLYAVLRRLANLVALPVTVATWVSAPTISAAHGVGDRHALAQASANGSQIAMLPGVVFFAVAIVTMPLLPAFLAGLGGGGMPPIYAVLLLGALGQVVFASSFTVATLCGLPRLAMTARAVMIAAYLLWFQFWGAELTIALNALGYAGALTLGGIVLWRGVRLRLGIDTSALVLLRIGGGRWKTS